MHQKLGGDTARTADPAGQRDVPYCVASCKQIKTGRFGKGGRGQPWPLPGD